MLIYVSFYWFLIAEYWKRRAEGNVCFITYEEMKRDLGGVIQKVGNFLNCPVPEENIPYLVDHLSFRNMKQNAAVNKQGFVEVRKVFWVDLKETLLRT